MNHTIGQRAERIDVPASTLRYYDKEGLLPFIHRTEGGIRVFTDSDIEWLQVIGCRKKAGRSIEDIRKYIQLTLKGDDTIELRLALFTHQREVLKKQREELSIQGTGLSTNAGFMKRQRKQVPSMFQRTGTRKKFQPNSVKSGRN